MKGSKIITVSILLANLVIYCNSVPTHLQPVHELYIRPSVDGTTGDLYVAATEESGSKSQWLSDKPVHFLQTDNDDSYRGLNLNTKRAVATPQLSQQVVQDDFKIIASQPSTETSQTANSEVSIKSCERSSTPQYNPYYNHFYSQMLAAYSNMMNVLKNTGFTNKMATAALAPHSSSTWVRSYAYPVQYVMVGPNTLNQDLTAPTAEAPKHMENESESE